MNKKFLSSILALLLILSMGTFALSESLAGGWSMLPDIPVCELPDTLDDLFEHNLGLLGMIYQPILYLGTQVVAGTNHLVLCSALPVVPDALPHLVAVTIYENLSGELQVLSIVDVDWSAFLQPQTHG